MEVIDLNFEYDLNKICRSCRRDAAELQSIFDSVGDDGTAFTEMLSSCTQLEVQLHDELPHNICASCVAEVIAAYNFRRRYEQSDLILREYITRRKLGDTEDEVSMGHKNAFQVKVELFDIKPELSFIDTGVPLTRIRSDSEPTEVAIIQELEKEVLSRGGKYETEFIDESDEDEGNFVDYRETSLDGIIEEVSDIDYQDSTAVVEKKSKGYTKRRLRGGQFECNTCGEQLPDKRSAANHVRKAHGVNSKLECSICERAFSSNYHLLRHKSKCQGNHDDEEGKSVEEDQMHCEYCKSTFSAQDYAEYKDHMEIVHPGMSLLPQAANKFQQRDLELPIELAAPKKEKLEAICRICDTTFERIVALRRHLKVHVDPDTLTDCNITTKPYLFEEGYVPDNSIEYLVQQVCKGELVRFYQIVQPDGQELELSDSDSEPEADTIREHRCALCSQTFPRIQAIMQHAKDNHHSEEQLGCEYCARVFPNNALLVRHLKQQCENHDKKFFCSFCNEKFMWQTSLNKHAQCVHRPTKPLLEKKRPPESTLESDHSPKERKKFVCKMCGKGFQRLEHLDRHVKIHIPSEKKFECTQCQKKFNRKDNLRSHMKIHRKDPELTNKQNHLCVYCGRGFSNSSNLIVHMRRHTGERPYKCDICDKGFPRSSDLQCHRRTHTGEKPCLCTICGKGFSRSNKLVRHMRIHTGARPYSCTYCDRAFTQSNDLTLHIRRHTGEKPYVCGVCNERFIQGTALKAHQRATGHLDDGTTQPERFASISVNNPNRLGINGPKALRQNTSATSVLPPLGVGRKRVSDETSTPKSATMKPRSSKKSNTPRSSKAAAAARNHVPVNNNPTDSLPIERRQSAADDGASSSGLVVDLPIESPVHNDLNDSAAAHPIASIASDREPILQPANVISSAIVTGSGTPGTQLHSSSYVSVPYIMQSYDLSTAGLFSQTFSQ